MAGAGSAGKPIEASKHAHRERDCTSMLDDRRQRTRRKEMQMKGFVADKRNYQAERGLPAGSTRPQLQPSDDAAAGEEIGEEGPEDRDHSSGREGEGGRIVDRQKGKTMMR